MVSKDEQVGRLRAAIAARRDPDTVIVARTGVFSELPREEALDRVRAYAQTGAEAIMLPGLRDGPAILEQVSEITESPLLVLGLPPELLADRSFIERTRTRIAFLEQHPYRMAVKAVWDSLDELTNGTTPEASASKRADRNLMRQIDRTHEFERWQERFLRE